MWDTVDANVGDLLPQTKHPHLTSLSSTTGRDQERELLTTTCDACPVHFSSRSSRGTHSSMAYRKGLDVIQDIHLAAKRAAARYEIRPLPQRQSVRKRLTDRLGSYARRAMRSQQS